jgi:hypothetical protein
MMLDDLGDRTIDVMVIEPVAITDQQVGERLANGNSMMQASILAWWADVVGKWKYDQSWSVQCRFIAEHMNDEQCLAVAGVLESLIEHLHAIPIERKFELATSRHSTESDL